MPSPRHLPLRYLVIVGRGDPDLLAYLTAALAGDPAVRVIAERRRTGGPEERRQRERRRSATTSLDGDRVTVARELARPGVDGTAKIHHDNDLDDLGSFTVQEDTVMDATASAQVRTQLTRWVEESRQLFDLLPRVLEELGRSEHECARLRERLEECRGEIEQLRAERMELADSLATLVAQMTRPVHDLVEKLNPGARSTA